MHTLRTHAESFADVWPKVLEITISNMYSEIIEKTFVGILLVLSAIIPQFNQWKVASRSLWIPRNQCQFSGEIGRFSIIVYSEMENNCNCLVAKFCLTLLQPH